MRAEEAKQIVRDVVEHAINERKKLTLEENFLFFEILDWKKDEDVEQEKIKELYKVREAIYKRERPYTYWN